MKAAFSVVLEGRGLLLLVQIVWKSGLRSAGEVPAEVWGAVWGVVGKTSVSRAAQWGRYTK